MPLGDLLGVDGEGIESLKIPPPQSPLQFPNSLWLHVAIIVWGGGGEVSYPKAGMTLFYFSTL